MDDDDEDEEDWEDVGETFCFSCCFRIGELMSLPNPWITRRGDSITILLFPAILSAPPVLFLSAFIEDIVPLVAKPFVTTEAGADIIVTFFDGVPGISNVLGCDFGLLLGMSFVAVLVAAAGGAVVVILDDANVREGTTEAVATATEVAGNDLPPFLFIVLNRLPLYISGKTTS